LILLSGRNRHAHLEQTLREIHEDQLVVPLGNRGGHAPHLQRALDLLIDGERGYWCIPARTRNQRLEKLEHAPYGSRRAHAPRVPRERDARQPTLRDPRAGELPLR
jgi:hypothetical protein